MPPAPTFGPGCCAGNSPRTWSFCSNIDDVRNCMEADECTWYEGDPYSPECTPPTPEPTMPTPAPSGVPTLEPTITRQPTLEPTIPEPTTSAWPTPSPTEEVGCCYGATPSTNTFCSTMDEDKSLCEQAAVCEWVAGEYADCKLTEPPSPTKQPTTPSPTYDEKGCCTGYSPRTYSFCQQYETGEECEMAGVCSWIPTDDYDDCGPPTEPPSFTLPPAPTPGVGEGCCAGNTPRTWSYCMNIDDEYMCVSAQECTWIFTDDPYTDECTPPTKEPTPVPTPLPTPDDEGCCSGTDYDIHSWTYCAKFDNGVDCESSPVCDWIGGEYAECEPPTEPPSPTEPPAPTPSPTPGCCYSDGKYAAFCFSLEDERSCTAAPNCDWEETDDYTVCEPPTPTPTTPAPVYEEGCCTGYSPKTYTFCSDFETGEKCENAGVCSWIATDDPDDCILTEPPSATMPPAPTKGPGCCTGNSPRTR